MSAFPAPAEIPMVSDPKDNEDFEIFNVMEAAKFLKISPSMVKYLVYQGKLPAKRIGRRILLRRRDLRAYINQ